MILVLGNFAGVFANLLKLVTWSILKNDDDTILFYYTNKKSNNLNPRVLPWQNFQQDIHRIFFYKYFQFPKECSYESFHTMNQFELGWPTIQNEILPEFLHNYPNGFIPCTTSLYKDTNLPLIRHYFHTHFEKRLSFTPYMNSLLEPELDTFLSLQKNGKRILAVFLRCSSHFTSEVRLDEMFHEIKEKAKEFDYLFPVTQIKPFMDTCIHLFGEKCIRFSRPYLNENIEAPIDVSDEIFEEEFQCCVRDVYLASKCDFILGGSSNMFIGALLWNPTVPYKLFDELRTNNGG